VGTLLQRVSGIETKQLVKTGTDENGDVVFNEAWPSEP